MKDYRIKLENLCEEIIPMGFVGENLYRRVIIDCRAAFDEYPDAVPGLSVRPPKGDLYPGIVTRDGDAVVWEITDSDLVYPGDGEIQLSFTVDNVVKRSDTGNTRICRSIVPTGRAPSPIDKWMDKANAALDEVNQAIEDLPDTVAEKVSEQVGNLIDDEAGTGDTDKVWSADKLTKEFDEKASKEDIEGKADAFYGSGSGDSVYVCDAVPDKKFVGFVADLPYTQNLNGQEHPYPKGMSPNIWPLERSYVKEVGQTGIPLSMPLPAGTYTLSLMATSDTVNTWTLGYNEGRFVYSETKSINSISRVRKKITVPEGYNLWVEFGGSSSAEIHFNDIQLLKGDVTNTTFYPVENVCPVGYAGIELYRTGKNLLDESKYITQDTGSSMIQYRVPVDPGEEYTFSVDDPEQHNNRVYAENTDMIFSEDVWAGNPRTVRMNEYGDHILLGYKGTNATNVHHQLERGAHATEYEPYCEDVFTTSWADSIGNVVCGTYNAVTGEIICTGASVTKAWSDFADKQETAEYIEGQFMLDAVAYADRETILCDKLYYSETPAAGTFHMDQNNIIHAYVPVGTADDKEFTFYYRTEPVVYQADPSEIRTKPVMTLKANTGSIAVEYIVGIKEYVDQSMMDVPVIDVTLNNESIVDRQVAKLPIAKIGKHGIMKVDPPSSSTPPGLTLDYQGGLSLDYAYDSEIKTGSYTNRRKPITIYTQHVAAFYGLAKVAGADMAESSNPVGTYTEEAKAAIKEMLGISEPTDMHNYLICQEFTCAYSMGANEAKTFTQADFSFSVPTGYETVGIASFSSGSDSVSVCHVQPGSDSNFMMLRSSGAISDRTARVAVLFAKAT